MNRAEATSAVVRLTGLVVIILATLRGIVWEQATVGAFFLLAIAITDRRL